MSIAELIALVTLVVILAAGLAAVMIFRARPNREIARPVRWR